MRDGFVDERVGVFVGQMKCDCGQFIRVCENSDCGGWVIVCVLVWLYVCVCLGCYVGIVCL